MREGLRILIILFTSNLLINSKTFTLIKIGYNIINHFSGVS